MDYKRAIYLIRTYGKNHVWLFVICSVLIVFESISGSLAVASLIPITSGILNGESVELGLPLIDGFVSDLVSDSPLNILVLLASILLLKVISSTGRTISGILLGEKCRAEGVSAMLKRFLKDPVDEHAHQEEGFIISNITELPRGAQQFLIGLTTYVSLIAQIAALLAAMIFINWEIVLVSSLIIFFVHLLIQKPYYTYAKNIGKVNISYSQKVMTNISEAVRNIRDIKLLNLHKYINKNNDSDLLEHRRIQFMTRVSQALPNLSIEFIFSIILFLLYFLAQGVTLEEIRTSLPEIAFFIVGAQRLLAMGAMVTGLNFKMITTYQRFSMMDEYLAPKPSIHQTPNIQKLDKIQGVIKFENTCYNYIDSTPVFQNINITIPLGKLIFVLGPSGCGKSTFMDLLTRVREPVSGKITYNDIELNQFDLAEWQSKAGYVSQEPTLLQGTIAENISLFDETVEVDDIVQAAKEAKIHDFIVTLPEGYATKIYRSGNSLSGGQKRRIAIARALVRRPEILIFDEALTAISEGLERDLLQGLTQENKYSIFVISHRLVNMELASDVILFKDGKISLKQYEEIKNDSL